MKKHFLNKKGQSAGLDAVPSIVITLGLIAIILGIMSTVLTQVQTTQCVSDSTGTYFYANNTCYRTLDTANATERGTAAYNISTQGLSAQTSMSGWQSTWAVIAAAAVVIGLVAGFLYMRRTG